MKWPIRWLRWVLVVLYVLLVGALVVSSVSGEPGMLVAIGVGIACQVVFLMGAGVHNLCEPVHRGRLVLPVAVAGAMMAIVVGGVLLALLELFRLAEDDWLGWVFWALVAGAWLLWGLFFHVHASRTDRYQALRRMTTTVLAGSVVALLGMIPSHLIVSRRPGCLAGLGTAISISAGLSVMLWAFGPGIILLFLHEIRQAEQRRAQRSAGR